MYFIKNNYFSRTSRYYDIFRRIKPNNETPLQHITTLEEIQLSRLQE